MIDQHQVRHQAQRGIAQHLAAYVPEMLFGQGQFLDRLLGFARVQPRRQFDVVAAVGQSEVAGEGGFGCDVGDEVRIGGQHVPGNGQRAIDVAQPAAVLRVQQKGTDLSGLGSGHTGATFICDDSRNSPRDGLGHGTR